MPKGVVSVLETLGWGVTAKDRALIAAYYGMLLSSKIFRPGERVGQGMHPEFWLGNVLVQTPAGRFECRGHSTDMDIVNPRYESVILETIEAKLRASTDSTPVFVDIGAHIGKYTVLAGRILKGRGHVVAIEPDPENFRLLRRNVDLNGLTNVDLLNVGCWSRDTVLLLHKGRGNLGQHSFIDDVGPDSVSVPVRTLDSILADLELPTVDLLKMDVQRAEAEVLKGAAITLQGSRSMTVIFEEMGNLDASESVRILEAQGFRIRRRDVFNYMAER